MVILKYQRNSLMRLYTVSTLLLLLVVLSSSIGHAETADELIQRGRYLVSISGCNDCHTPNFPERGGQVPEAEWLTGVEIGFRGPWGTSYPSNLRIVASQMNETQFIARARSEMLPPMPWFSLRAMSDADLTAVYQFIKSLGRSGEPAPLYAAPGEKTMTPYIVFVPQSGDQETVATH